VLSFQVVVKKVSRQHRWYLEHASCDRASCWKEQILLSARGFSVFFQMLVKAQKVGRYLFWAFLVFCILDVDIEGSSVSKMRFLKTSDAFSLVTGLSTSNFFQVMLGSFGERLHVRYYMSLPFLVTQELHIYYLKLLSGAMCTYFTVEIPEVYLSLILSLPLLSLFPSLPPHLVLKTVPLFI
jgi:hypothetical protein